MNTLAGLIRLFERSAAPERIQLKASDLGHCAIYEKELERFWPVTEENRKAKIAEFGQKRGFRLAYYKEGHCAIFLDDPTSPPRQNSLAPRCEPMGTADFSPFSRPDRRCE